MNGLIETTRRNLEKRLTVESYFYLNNEDKNKIHSDTNNTKETVNVNLLKNKYFLSSVIGLSIIVDCFYLKYNISRVVKNAAFRVLMANSIYYILFTDYDKFYHQIYTKYYLKYN